MFVVSEDEAAAIRAAFEQIAWEFTDRRTIEALTELAAEYEAAAKAVAEADGQAKTPDKPGDRPGKG